MTQPTIDDQKGVPTKPCSYCGTVKPINESCINMCEIMVYPQSTIDSELEELLKIPLLGGDIQDLADGIKKYAAQEANKAVVAELEKCAEVILWHPGGVMSKEKAEKMWYTHINNHIKALTSDKEQNNG